MVNFLSCDVFGAVFSSFPILIPLDSLRLRHQLAWAAPACQGGSLGSCC